ncbi:MAG TPA: hypothetical protein VJ717_13470 [Gemmatimonadaceae bacterium]|nr:hypothetical protein [Gemmatimonadaceae bacterium]
MPARIVKVHARDRSRLAIPEVPVSRRSFLYTMSAVAGSAALGGFAGACGSDSGAGPPPPPEVSSGAIHGIVTDMQGVQQSSLGRLYLMRQTGQQTGRVAEVTAGGHFLFENLEPRDYKVRFHAAARAYVPDGQIHPVPVTVERGKTADITVKVQLGVENAMEVEIYAGDDFFQLQPDGIENGITRVKVGTTVCWYNVGTQPHSITGGPWRDSGDLNRSQNFIWVADQVGVFPYRCRYHTPHMAATLEVVA